MARVRTRRSGENGSGGRPGLKLIEVLILAIVGPIVVLYAKGCIEERSTVLFRGRVVDKTTSEPVSMVKLTFHAPTDPSPVETDARGDFYFRAKKGFPSPIRVAVTRAGYIDAVVNASLASEGYFGPIYIEKAASQTPASPTPATSPSSRSSARVRVGGPFNVEVGGCQNAAQEFRVDAPGDLDRSKGGQGVAPSGWEIEVGGNGSHGIRNISANGNSLTFVLNAEGGGAMQNIPLIGDRCIGPTGANSSAVIYAWVFH